MSPQRLISAEKLGELVAELTDAGVPVVAPTVLADGTSAYAHIDGIADASFNQSLPVPSLKAHFLPPNEVLLSWSQSGTDIEITPASSVFPQQVVLGARPCDVAALEVVDAVMNWDYADDLWNGRRRATTLFAMACPGVDTDCFCTAVGIGPDSSRAADAMMVPVDGGFLVEFTSEKGEQFLGEYGEFFDEAGEVAVAEAESFRSAARARVESNLSVDTGRIARWIDGHFDDELWPTLGPRCNGCGACSFVCPTCHCFDINDEPAGVGAGTRRRNWDTCQSGKFTLHASGHNPRADQNARHRQRISHKFYIYPSKFGEVLCTGCGRCIRSCPSSQDLIEILRTIDKLAVYEEEALHE